MSDFFKKVTKSGLPVALTGKDEGAFFAGFVENADEEFLFMQAVSPSGHFDGWACVRIEEIARADVATEYLVMLARVFEYYGEEFREPKISARDVLASFIDQAIKNKWLCTAEVGFETLDKLTGYFVEKDFDTVQMQARRLYFVRFRRDCIYHGAGRAGKISGNGDGNACVRHGIGVRRLARRRGGQRKTVEKEKRTGRRAAGR